MSHRAKTQLARYLGTGPLKHTVITTMPEGRAKLHYPWKGGSHVRECTCIRFSAAIEVWLHPDGTYHLTDDTG